MGLDCYINVLNDDNSIGEEVAYFCKFWELHNWMVEYYLNNGGELHREDYCNNLRIPVDVDMLTELEVDIKENKEKWFMSSGYTVLDLKSKLPLIYKTLHLSKNLVYYGSY